MRLVLLKQLFNMCTAKCMNRDHEQMKAAEAIDWKRNWKSYEAKAAKAYF